MRQNQSQFSMQINVRNKHYNVIAVSSLTDFHLEQLFKTNIQKL